MGVAGDTMKAETDDRTIPGCLSGGKRRGDVANAYDESDEAQDTSPSSPHFVGRRNADVLRVDCVRAEKA